MVNDLTYGTSYNINLLFSGIPFIIKTDDGVVFNYLQQIFKRYIVKGHNDRSKGIFFISNKENLIRWKDYRENIPVVIKNTHYYSVETRKTIVSCDEEVVCCIYRKIKSMDSFYYNYLHPSLLEFLYRNRVFFFHSAALQHQTGKTFYILSPGGNGKTTISLSCLMNGFSILSDDTVFVNSKDKKTFALLRPLHVHKTVWEQYKLSFNLEENDEYMPNTDKYNLNLEINYPDLVKDYLPLPQFIIYPRIINQIKTSLVKTTPETAVIRLAEQSYQGLERGNEFSAYSELIEYMLNIPSYEILLGKDSLNSSNVISGILDELILRG